MDNSDFMGKGKLSVLHVQSSISQHKNPTAGMRLQDLQMLELGVETADDMQR